MPDADDFDVEELRALLKGGGPKPAEAQTPETAAPAAPKKPGGAATGGESAPSRRRGAKRAATKPPARGQKRTGR
jgi:hypothetical protein